MSTRNVLEGVIAVVAIIFVLIIIISVSIKETAKNPCDFVCKGANYCSKEKLIPGDTNNYIEIECQNGSKYIITEIKK